ncbi:lactoylglutathione lyase [Pyrus ussuriensis x Pyrus communis]|uniref:Lactoylglutathione lyase n=1 Tax=Pyrus ussuriensis x Pyrus communis TaxID=2448454 RepID=A0A5N5FX79_9ROSA|nr:lactoylglutathione lyase [Pyrus ussuriensis x Pyrus communis]
MRVILIELNILNSLYQYISYSLPILLQQYSRAVPHDDVLEWVQKDSRRFLRANIRVSDLDRTIKFYTELFGLKVLSRKDFPEEKYSNAIVGFGPEESHFVIGLTWHHNATDKLDIGTAFSHFGIATQDIYNTVEKVRASGGEITREPGPLVGGGTVYAFMNDPDGYSFELLQRPPTPEPLSHICLNVNDINRSIEFYNKSLGMNLLLKFDVPQEQYTVGMVGYGSNLTQTVVIELKYNYNVTAYRRGNGYAQVAIGTDDVYKSAAAAKLVIQEVGGKIIRPPGPIPKIHTKITAFLDTDGFETVLVDNEDYLKRIEERAVKQNP